MRTSIKTFTFAITHFIVAFTVVYLITGSWVIGGLVAMIEPAVNTVAYFIHERVWAHIEVEFRGRRLHLKFI